MRIIHLISSMDKGGAESHLASLTRMQSENNEIIIIYFKGNNYWKKKLKKKNIKIIRLNLKSKFILFQLFELLIKINKILKKYNPRVVHSHLTMMELVGAILTKFNYGNFKFIITKHLDSSFFEGSRGKKVPIKGLLIDKFIIKTAQKTICISKRVMKFFVSETKLPRSKFGLIYYGFDFQNFKKNKNFLLSNEFRSLNKINKKNFKLCCVARHVKQKSLDFLLNSFSEYIKINNKSNLILVGSGPETQNLKKLSEELGISKYITWIKFSDNVRDIIEFSDVFVLTSEYEGLGLVLLEAMASNTAIIATKTSAIPEVIKNNYNGLLVEHLNKKDLVKKINIIQTQKLYKKFCRNSKLLLKSKFNLNLMVNKTYKFYNE